MQAADFQESAEAEQEIQQMGYKKTDKISLHPVFRQENVQKHHVHGRGENVIPDTGLLLAQSLGHGIGDGIAVQHGNEKCVALQNGSRVPAVVQPTAQPVPGQSHNAPCQQAVKHGRLQAFLNQIPDPSAASCRGAPGQLRDQKLRKAEENAGRKHQHREDHSAEYAEGGQRI